MDSFTFANSIIFYTINWIGLVVLIWMVFRIRHTGDDTYLKAECGTLVGTWVFFSFIQYSTFVYNYVLNCHGFYKDLSS